MAPAQHGSGEREAPSLVVGRYAVFDAIAAGGMATVHLGRLLGPQGFAKTVAIKRLHPQFARNVEFRTMLMDEARIAARIHHPNVVSTVDVLEGGGELWVVMDYVRGESFSKLLRGAQAAGEAAPARIVAAIVSGALRGLHAAHEAVSETGGPLCIVHRDVSPQNILVGIDGTPRVLDFGVAKAEGRAHVTREGQVKGKLLYMSPEQLAAQPVTRAADIYAMGVVLFEALTGTHMFAGEDERASVTRIIQNDIRLPSQVARELGAFDGVVRRAVAADPRQRFRSARDMATELDRCALLAGPAEVGAWVRRFAGAAIAERAARVAEIESSTSSVRHPQMEEEPHGRAEIARGGNAIEVPPAQRERDTNGDTRAAESGERVRRTQAEPATVSEEGATSTFGAPDASEVDTLEPMGAQVGDLLGGKYLLEAELGSGGMGVVYRARNTKLNLPVAVKVLHEELAKRPGFVARFLREAKAATMVRHPHVVEVLDVDAASGVPYIVMELLEGVSLAEYQKTKGGLLSVPDVLEFLGPVMEALAEAHDKGVVHRDLKPDNVFLSTERDRLVPKLLDFGISAIRNDDQRVTVTGSTLGTPRYMAPEQVRLTRDADARSDIWSLGVMMYELLSGTMPFDGESAGAIYVAIATHEPPPLEKVVRDIPRSVSRIVARCMRREPSERYTSTRQLLRDLQLAQLDDDIAPLSPAPAVPDLALPGPKVSGAPHAQRSSQSSPSLPAGTPGLTTPGLGSPAGVSGAPAMELGLPPAGRPSGRMVAVSAGGSVPELGPVRHSSGQMPAARAPASSPSGAHGAARRNLEIELEQSPASLRPSQSQAAVAYGRHLRGEPPPRPFAPRTADDDTTAGAGLVPTLVVGAFSLASAAGFLRRLHEPEGWPVITNIAPETYPGSVQAVVGATIGAAGLASALLGLREKQMTIAVAGAGALFVGGVVFGEIFDLSLTRYGGFGLAVVAIAIWARIVFEGRRVWAKDSIVAKGVAVVIGLVAGSGLFAAVELAFGAL